MLLRRDFVTGALAAAAAACAPRQRAAAPTPPSAGPVAASWPPYRDAVAIDGAAAIELVLPEDMSAQERATIVAQQLAAARASGLTAVISTVAPVGRFWLDDAAFERAKRSLTDWRARIAEHPGELRWVGSAADLDAAHRERTLGVIFTFQGTEPLGEDVERIPLFHQLGVRVVQLTHNRRNLVGDGATEPGDAGLSNFGRDVIEQLTAARIVIDLAHGSRRTMREGIAAARAPLLISHTGCRALADLPRNTDDEVLRALADRGGVAGMIFWPYLRTDLQPTSDDLIRHLEHAIDVAGEDHVGIGSDTGLAPIERTEAFERDNREWVAEAVKQGIFERGRPADLYTFLPDLNVVDRYERLAARLAARGHGSARIGKILGGNFARVLREVWG